MEGVQVNAKESVEHAKKSSLVLEEIVNSVNEIAAMNSQVSTTSEQQSTAAASIAENINDFAHSIAEVSSNADNNASASAEVAELATGLQAQVSTFKV
jgi:methyl-accepting chemotaxis protein